ncbi:TIGR04076 family protein [Terasakiella sp. SH-1]|uniref:TIGR04076 family protein n=1 Tax=Terasakiella sp. SH-1 TaxID=2560057 RepID=UPI001073D047|nr:TIGR04076 family protein [Terasakiella sp. SH-1]
MSKEYKIHQLAGETECPWHKSNKETGKTYSHNEIFNSGVCPIMWHTLYPYFLGALFGAKYTYNEQGDCHVCCPAEKGVDVLVRVRANDGKFEEGVPDDWRDVIHAEVVKVNGVCDYDHKVGDRFVFPTCMKETHACPSGVHNMFPFMDIEIPKCINQDKIRCTDWLENMYFSLDAEDSKIKK